MARKPTQLTDTGLNAQDRLINEHKAAEILGLEIATLRRWRWSGSSLPFIRLDRAIRYSPADLHAFIDAGRRRSTSDTSDVT